MSDHISLYLKPIISNKDYQSIRDRNMYQTYWSDINKFIDHILRVSETVSVKNLSHNFSSRLLFQCKDQSFLTKEQSKRLNALYHMLPNNSLVSGDDQLKEHQAFLTALDKKVIYKSGYFEEESGEVTLKAVLLKRLHLCLSAEKRNLEFDLNDEDVRSLLERKTCYYTGAKFNNTNPNFKRTIDRIDCSKGYIKGNVVACTHNINQIKNLILEDGGEFKLTLKQLQMFVNKLSD